MLTGNGSIISSPSIKKTSLRQPPQRISSPNVLNACGDQASRNATPSPSPSSLKNSRPQWNSDFASSSPIIERSRNGLKPSIPSSSTTPFKVSASPHEVNQLRGLSKQEKIIPKGAGILLGYGASTAPISQSTTNHYFDKQPTITRSFSSFNTDIDNASRDILMQLLQDAKKKVAILELDVKVKEAQIRDLEESVDSLQNMIMNGDRESTDIEKTLSKQLAQEKAKGAKLEVELEEYRSAFTVERSDKIDVSMDLTNALKKLQEAESIMSAQQKHIIVAEQNAGLPRTRSLQDVEIYLQDNAPSYRDKVDQLEKRVSSLEIALAQERKLRVEAEFQLSNSTGSSSNSKINK